MFVFQGSTVAREASDKEKVSTLTHSQRGPADVREQRPCPPSFPLAFRRDAPGSLPPRQHRVTQLRGRLRPSLPRMRCPLPLCWLME